MLDVILFIAVSAGISLILWRTSGLSPLPSRLHRFLAVELLLILALVTRERWFSNPLSMPQMISWGFWTVALALALPALLQQLSNQSPTDLAATETGEALPLPRRRGIYGAVRHPFYAAALFMGWGLFAKNLAPFNNAALLDAFLLTGASLFIVSAAQADETADYLRFGTAYALYVKTSKMLIPFVL